MLYELEEANQTLERIGVGRCRFMFSSFPSFTSLFETGLPADLSADRSATFAFMKVFSPFLLAALVFHLFAGCSKKPSAPTVPVWSASSTIVINPIITIGTLRSGMTIQEVIAELGQPSRTNAAGLEFSGVGLFITPTSGGMTLFPPFAGSTKEGIGMGASRADIVRAYGEPPVSQITKPGFELLRYDALGIKFQLRQGKVDWIDVTSKP